MALRVVNSDLLDDVAMISSVVVYSLGKCKNALVKATMSGDSSICDDWVEYCNILK